MQKKLFVISFITILLLGFGLSLFNHVDYSYTERRKLKEFPNVLKYGKINEDFFSDLDDYLQDHFIARDFFRKIKIDFSMNILKNEDFDGIYEKEGYIFEVEEKVNDASVDYLANLVNQTAAYFDSEHIYFVALPNKSEYIEPTLNLNSYDEILEKLEKKLEIECINIKEDFKLEAFYRSDIHMNQDGYLNLYKHLSDYYPLKETEFEVLVYEEFYGGLYSRVPFNVEKDHLNYLYFEGIDEIIVYDYETNKEIGLYDFNDDLKMDPYNFYLYGPKGNLEINNPNGEGELVIFRDSYGSSFSTLLASSYAKIRIIDLRYYASIYLDDLQLNPKSDVLYLYGNEILQNSFSLK